MSKKKPLPSYFVIGFQWDGSRTTLAGFATEAEARAYHLGYYTAAATYADDANDLFVMPGDGTKVVRWIGKAGADERENRKAAWDEAMTDMTAMASGKKGRK